MSKNSRQITIIQSNVGSGNRGNNVGNNDGNVIIGNFNPPGSIQNPNPNPTSAFSTQPRPQPTPVSTPIISMSTPKPAISTSKTAILTPKPVISLPITAMSTPTTAMKGTNTATVLSQLAQTVPSTPSSATETMPPSSLPAITGTKSDSSRNHSTTTVQSWKVGVIVGALGVLALIIITGIIIFRKRRQPERFSILNANPSPYEIDHNGDLQQIWISNNFTSANGKRRFSAHRATVAEPLSVATRETGEQEPEGTAVAGIPTAPSPPLEYDINVQRTSVYSANRSTHPPSYREVEGNQFDPALSGALVERRGNV